MRQQYRLLAHFLLPLHIMNKKTKAKQQVNIKNKRASFDYEFIDTYTAGIVLTGPEIKSIREGKASLLDTYCIFPAGECWVKGMYVAPYGAASYNNKGERRDRKLLLNKKEIRILETEQKQAGITVVPTRLYINEKGLAKLVIALARGKHEYDKRQSIKEKEAKREIKQQFEHVRL